MIIPELDYRCDLTATAPAEIDADRFVPTLFFPLAGLAEKLEAHEHFPASLFNERFELSICGCQVGSVTAYCSVGFDMPLSAYDKSAAWECSQLDFDAQLSEAEEAYILRLIDEELGIA